MIKIGLWNRLLMKKYFANDEVLLSSELWDFLSEKKTSVKIEVWARDNGKCVICGSTENLHYDHDLPFSKGGTSLTAENVRILCMKHNLKKSDKILSLPPIFLS